MADCLTIKCFSLSDIQYGEENRITVDGHMTIDHSYGEKIMINDPFLKKAQIRFLPPRQHQCYSETVMDVLPLSTKVSGRLGNGITHTMTGLSLMLTGVDETGKQITNGGGCEGILQDHIAWDRPGTPSEDDWLLIFDITARKSVWDSREGINHIYATFDKFCQLFRIQMKKFNPHSYSEIFHYRDVYRRGLPDIVILKQVSGQGAVYDTLLFPDEPCGFAGGHSIIDMGNMPVFLTPNEYRDGAVRALD